MEPEKITYRLFESREGTRSMLVNSKGREVPVHSRISPSREAESMRDRFNPDIHDVLIVLGTGLGYHLMPLKETLERYSRVVLVDIISGIEREVAETPETSFLTESGIVMFVAGRDVESAGRIIQDEFENAGARGITVVEHPASVRIFPEYYSAIRETVKRAINRFAGNLATRKALGTRYFRNILRNMSQLGSLRPVLSLAGLMGGCPSLVIASGPSLDESIEHIAAARSGVYLISVDSALPVLSSRGIVPDALVAIDPQPYIYEHMQGYDMTGTVLVCSISAAPAVVEKYGGFLSLNSHPLSQVIDSAGPGAIGSIDSSTGTVAGDALNAALMMGSGPVGIVGFDFSFSSLSIYARGTAYQKRYSLMFQDRLSTVEQRNVDYIRKSSRGITRSGRSTRQSFIQYLESFEDFIAGMNRGGVYNINGGGIPLSGVEPLSMDSFLEKFCTGSVDRRGFRDRVEMVDRIDAACVRDSFREIVSDRSVLDELLSASMGETGLKKRGKYEHMVMDAAMPEG